MQFYLYSLSFYGLFFSCFFVFLIFSILGMFLVKKFNVNFKVSDNSAIFPIFYITCSTYAIMLGLICFQAITFSENSRKIVQKEFDAVIKLSYDIKILKQSPSTHLLNDALTKYINNIIKLEWPAMSKVKRDDNNKILLEKMMTILRHYESTNSTDANQQIIINNTYYDIVELSKLREDRFEITTDNIISIYEWLCFVCIIFSTLITSMFLVIRFKLQIVMLLILITVFSAAVTLIVNIDAPFIGAIKLEPSQYMDDINETSSDY